MNSSESNTKMPIAPKIFFEASTLRLITRPRTPSGNPGLPPHLPRANRLLAVGMKTGICMAKQAVTKLNFRLS